jgi:hypothetical protein
MTCKCGDGLLLGLVVCVHVDAPVSAEGGGQCDIRCKSRQARC